MNSIMRDKIKSVVFRIIGIAIIVIAWEIGAIIVNESYVLPHVGETLLAAKDLFFTADFYLSIFYTLFRVILGLAIGIVLGLALGTAIYKFDFVAKATEPFLSIIKSTPIASIIILLWFILRGTALAVVVTVLMILPIITESVVAGYKNQSKDLLEVAKIFKFPFIKRLQTIIIPSLFTNLIPSIITCVGLAWKAEVAAEIIGKVSNSIGSGINDANSQFTTRVVFAWTMIVIGLSIILETITKSILMRWKK